MRRFLSLVLNRFMALAVPLVCARLVLRFSENGAPIGFNDGSAELLKYFTVLSNLLLGAASLLFAIGLELKLCGVLKRVPRGVRLLKYMAVAAVGLTFATVLCFIGPRTGFRGSYKGANLWLHLILPVMAMLEYLLIDREGRLRFRHTFLCLICPAAYGVFYLGNLIINGYGGQGHPNDWYGFADSGPAGVFVVIAALVLGAWLIGLVLSLPKLRRAGKAKSATHEASN